MYYVLFGGTTIGREGGRKGGREGGIYLVELCTMCYLVERQ